MAGSSRLPVIAVIGATGTGKSKLAIHLAKVFRGEIISADSMQVYKGLDIITNKVTSQERQEVLHHLIDFVDPLSHYTVTDFRNTALSIVDEIKEKSKIPIIVGGTYYYIESLVWNILVDTLPMQDSNILICDRDKTLYAKDKNVDNTKCELHKLPKDISCNWRSVSTSTEQLYKILNEVDPESASRYHPNDRRKIIRSLQVWEQIGKKHSSVLKEQQESPGGSSRGGGLRFKDAIFLWLTCQQDVLDKRLDDRVDEMVSLGLLKELEDFHNNYNLLRQEAGQPLNYTEGIFQSIGFKEFHEYLTLANEDKTMESGDMLYEKCLGEMKIATKRYSRKQLKWIKNRFLLPDREVPSVYTFDCTSLNDWEMNVIIPAEKLVSDVIMGNPTSLLPVSHLEPIASINKADKTRYVCEICDRIFIGELQWQAHLNGQKHYKMKKRTNKSEDSVVKKQNTSSDY